MRESNFSFPSQNRAVVSITHMLYDRRALDTSSPLAILNNLTALTYLTSTSPRIREILTIDGGLERLLDILRDSTLPRDTGWVPDLWGLNGPPTARVISVDRQIILRHSLAFQCVVNIGVRGSEAIRTRVVQAGALDLVAQILESWLRQHGIAIFAGALGSQAAVDAHAAGLPVPGVERRRHRDREREREQNSRTTPAAAPAAPSSRTHGLTAFLASLNPRSMRLDPARLAGGLLPRGAAREEPSEELQEARGDTDVDMADAEGEGDADVDTDATSVGADESMDLDDASRSSSVPPPESGPSTTPRASQVVLPMSIPSRAISRETQSQASSAANSLSSDNFEDLPRVGSENNLATVQRPPPLSTRLGHLANETTSTQSSPTGTPADMTEGRPRRRDTIVARPLHLAPRDDRDRGDGGSETSDGGADVDLMTATIRAGVAAAQAQTQNNPGGVLRLPDPQDGNDEDLNVAEPAENGMMGEPDPEALEQEQARLDMEAGAPPTQLPQQPAQTPRNTPGDATTTPTQALVPPQAAPAPGTEVPEGVPNQTIIANSAPRGFRDLGSYVGINAVLNPEGDRYSDDSILLALQLLAYLSKYPHVRAAFHHPRRPVHPTFNLNSQPQNPLPERPPCSETPNIFSLVERYTFRPSPNDPQLFKIPAEVQYWAGVIMRNACRKDDARGGIRQCANMTCGRWETSPREFAKCRRCRKAKYCSKECQSRAWSMGHKFWCSARPDEEQPGAPGNTGGPGGPRPPPPDDDDGDQDHDENMNTHGDAQLARALAMRDRQQQQRGGGQGQSPRQGGGNGNAPAGTTRRARDRSEESSGTERENRGGPSGYASLLSADAQLSLLRETMGGTTSQDRQRSEIPTRYQRHNLTQPMNTITPHGESARPAPRASSQQQQLRAMEQPSIRNVFAEPPPTSTNRSNPSSLWGESIISAAPRQHPSGQPPQHYSQYQSQYPSQQHPHMVSTFSRTMVSPTSSPHQAAFTNSPRTFYPNIPTSRQYGATRNNA